MDSYRLLILTVIKLASKTVTIAHYIVAARVSDGVGMFFYLHLPPRRGAGRPLNAKK